MTEWCDIYNNHKRTLKLMFNYIENVKIRHYERYYELYLQFIFTMKLLL